MNKWWLYQKERFPIFQYIPMVMAFAFSGLSYARRVGDMAFDNWICPEYAICVDLREPLQFFHYLVAMITTLIWFMLLRIIDEHKDYEEDKKYRPYRAVSRGLVTLKELRYLAILLVVIQIGLTLWVNTALAFTLVIAYAWFFLMSFEFGVGKWLKKQHALYLLSHMIMIVLINFYLTSFEWASYSFSSRLIPYLLVGYVAGLVFEVGRKIRSKEEEEEGVNTYSAVWGIKKSVIIWLSCVAASLITVFISAYVIEMGGIIIAIFAPLYLIALYFSTKFMKLPTKSNAKFFKVFPAIWLLLIYFVLGIVSWL